MNLGQYNQAERNFQYILSDYKGTVYELKSHYSLGELYYNKLQDQKALVKFKYVVKNYPGTKEAQQSIRRIERIYTDLGKTDEFEQFVRSVPNYSKSQFYFDSLAYRAALNKYQDGNYNSAITEFSKYLNKYKNGIFKIESHYYRANSYENRNELKKAIADYKFVADARVSEFRERSIYKTARLSKETQDANTALVYYQKWEVLVKNDKDLAEAVYEQLHILHKEGNIAKAKPKASQLLYNKEASAYMKGESNLVLGKAMVNDSLLNTAISYFTAVSKVNDNELGAESKYLEAWCYYGLDSLEKCKQTIIAFNKRFSGYDYWLGKSLLLLSDYYVAKGDKFSAKSTINSVIANFEDERILSEAREKLARIEKSDTRLNNINNLAPGSGD